MNKITITILIVSAFLAGAMLTGTGLEGVGYRATDRVEKDGPRADDELRRVEISRQGADFHLYRNGKPYFIKGIGGNQFLESAAAAGANSVRTWGAHDAGKLLDRAQGLKLTVTLGIWLSHNPADYADPAYKKRKTQEIQKLVAQYQRHPALLLWALGNEINLDGADTAAAWRFVNSLAEMIKRQDGRHPVISVIACKARTLEKISAHAPALDAVGINAYGALSRLRAVVDASTYSGPYLVTEWGVAGHWEAQRTFWGRPIEPTSTWKARFQLAHYSRDILGNKDRCIGSYVFLWGQKQERTSTWYSMFLKDIPDEGVLSCPTVDAMQFNWTGSWPANRAPEISGMRINGLVPKNNVVLSPGDLMISKVQARDPEHDRLSYVWELLKEPSKPGHGGSHEARPASLTHKVQDAVPVLSFHAPEASGQYRLFVYVLDNKGHAATANIPFQVRQLSGQPQSSAPGSQTRG